MPRRARAPKQPRHPFEFTGDEAAEARRASAASYRERTRRLKRSILAPAPSTPTLPTMPASLKPPPLKRPRVQGVSRDVCAAEQDKETRCADLAPPHTACREAAPEAPNKRVLNGDGRRKHVEKTAKLLVKHARRRVGAVKESVPSPVTSTRQSARISSRRRNELKGLRVSGRCGRVRAEGEVPDVARMTGAGESSFAACDSGRRADTAALDEGGTPPVSDAIAANEKKGMDCQGGPLSPQEESQLEATPPQLDRKAQAPSAETEEPNFSQEKCDHAATEGRVEEKLLRPASSRAARTEPMVLREVKVVTAEGSRDGELTSSGDHCARVTPREVRQTDVLASAAPDSGETIVDEHLEVSLKPDKNSSSGSVPSPKRHECADGDIAMTMKDREADAAESSGAVESSEPSLEKQALVQAGATNAGSQISRDDEETDDVDAQTEEELKCSLDLGKKVEQEGEIEVQANTENMLSSSSCDGKAAEERPGPRMMKVSAHEDTPEHRPQSKEVGDKMPVVSPRDDEDDKSGGKMQEPMTPEPPKRNGVPGDILDEGKQFKKVSATVSRKSTVLPKRVRFSEPDKSYRAINNKVGLLSIRRQRRRRELRRGSVDHAVHDISVAPAEGNNRDGKGRQMLLDELQYLLDGIFKTLGGDQKPMKGMAAQLVTSSLTSLVRLLLRKSESAVEESASLGGQECGAVLQILGQQPDLLKTIVNRLFSVLGSSRTVDVLVALVLVVIFQSTSHILLVGENELDLLLNGFFRNSGSSLTEDKVVKKSAVPEKGDSTERPSQARRRGIFGRRFDGAQHSLSKSVLSNVNDLVIEAEAVGDAFDGFKNVTDGSVFLMGMSLALLLEKQEETRNWMLENRRLDRVVAVLYSCEKVIGCLGSGKDGAEGKVGRLSAADIAENRTISVVMGASMRILEFASLNSACQLLLSGQSKVGLVVLDVIRRIINIDDDIRAAEAIMSDALKLCLNLTHGCQSASEKFVKAHGTKIVMDCLTRECIGAGLVQGEKGCNSAEDDVVEMFDVRVLCLSLLASIVYVYPEERDRFRETHASGVADREGGAIAVVLEMIKNAAKETTMEGAEDRAQGMMGRAEEFGGADGGNGEDGSPREGGGSMKMERKITVGYSCLLLGAVAKGNRENGAAVEKAMPGRMLLSVATVLDEFLEFQHEVGIVDAGMDRMYREIIESMTEGVQLETVVDSGADGGGKAAVDGDGDGADRMDTG